MAISSSISWTIKFDNNRVEQRLSRGIRSNNPLIDLFFWPNLRLIFSKKIIRRIYLNCWVSFSFLYLTSSMPLASLITSAFKDLSKASKLLRFKQRCRISRNCSCGPSELCCIQFCNNNPVTLPAFVHMFSVLLARVINLSLYTIEKSKMTRPSKLGLPDDILKIINIYQHNTNTKYIIELKVLLVFEMEIFL